MRYFEFLIEGYKEVAQKYVASGADPSQVKDTLTKFKEIVNKNQVSGDQRNIDWWGKNKSFDDFARFIKSIDISRTKTQVKRQKVAGDSINLLENDEWLVVIPLDKDASCFHGKNTDWCTAKPNQDQYEDYFLQGIILIYCINKKSGNRWAIAKYDNKKIILLDKNNNDLTKEQFQLQTKLDPVNLIKLASKHESTITDIRKNSLLKDAESAFTYAATEIKGPWPEGEKVIASDPTWAYYYARDVLNDPEPKNWRERYLAGEAK